MFICTHDSKYCYASLIIQLKHQSFVYKQFNIKTVRFLTIRFNVSHLFAHSLNVKEFHLTHRWEPISCYHTWPEWTWERWQWRDTLHSPKFQGLFRRLLESHYQIVWRSLISLLGCSLYFLQPQPTGPDCLMSYPGHSLGKTYSTAEIQSVYFTAPTPSDWTLNKLG